MAGKCRWHYGSKATETQWSSLDPACLKLGCMIWDGWCFTGWIGARQSNTSSPKRRVLSGGVDWRWRFKAPFSETKRPSTSPFQNRPEKMGLRTSELFLAVWLRLNLSVRITHQVDNACTNGIISAESRNNYSVGLQCIMPKRPHMCRTIDSWYFFNLMFSKGSEKCWLFFIYWCCTFDEPAVHSGTSERPSKCMITSWLSLGPLWCFKLSRKAYRSLNLAPSAAVDRSLHLLPPCWEVE